MLPVSASTVKKFILSPSRRYFTTALAPMSLSSARIGPFNTVTVWPKVNCVKSQRERDVETGKDHRQEACCRLKCYTSSKYDLRVMMARAQSVFLPQ